MRVNHSIGLSPELTIKLREVCDKTGVSMSRAIEVGMRAMTGMEPPPPVQVGRPTSKPRKAAPKRPPGRPRTRPVVYRVPLLNSVWTALDRCAKLEGVDVAFVLEEGWPGSKQVGRSITGEFPGLANRAEVLASVQKFIRSVKIKHGLDV